MNCGWLNNPIAATRRGGLFSGRQLRRLAWPLLAAELLLSTGCRAPIGVKAVSYPAAFQATDQSALNGTQLSQPTLLVLDRYDLSRQFSKDPNAALATLQERACNDSRRDLLCALAELNYFQGAKLRSSKPARDRESCDYYLAAAVYAYLFLFGEGSEPPPGALDPRYRLACDLYNRALAQGLREPGASDEHMLLSGGERPLPAGPLKIACGLQDFGLPQQEIDKVLPADRFLVRGLRTRDRNPGLGAPLIVVGRNSDARRSPRHAPATAFPASPRRCEKLGRWWPDGVPGGLFGVQQRDGGDRGTDAAPGE